MRMSASILAAFAMSAPLPALAQIETVDPDLAATEASREQAQLVDRLGDPDFRQELAATIATLSEVVLDLPLAPLADAMADAGVEAADDIPDDATLRRLAPGTDRIPEELEENLPRAMEAMASMAKGIEAMMPALRDMAARMKEALPRDIAPEG